MSNHSRPWHGLFCFRVELYLDSLAALFVLLLSGCAAAPASSHPAAPHSSPAAATAPFRVSGITCKGTELDATLTNIGRRQYTAQIQAKFLTGTAVTAENTSGFSGGIDPGQSEVLRVQNITDDGIQGPASSTCEYAGYAVQLPDGTYVGSWPAAG